MVLWKVYEVLHVYWQLRLLRLIEKLSVCKNLEGLVIFGQHQKISISVSFLPGLEKKRKTRIEKISPCLPPQTTLYFGSKQKLTLNMKLCVYMKVTFCVFVGELKCNRQTSNSTHMMISSWCGWKYFELLLVKSY